jgi:deoxycytidylate deaminase
MAALDEIVPEWGQQNFVPATDPYMAMALARCAEMVARHPETSVPTATVIVRDGKVLALENGGQIHLSFCPRVALGSKSGTEYEYCPDHCHSDNHGEARAARFLRENGMSGEGATAYLAGHYWACMPCWQALKSAGVTTLRIADDAEKKLKERRHSPRAGMLPRAVSIRLHGDTFSERANLEVALRRVGFDVVLQQTRTEPEVILLLPGSPEAEATSAHVVDARATRDYKDVLTQLSRELEKLFS